MGSFPHEFTGYRHVSDNVARGIFEKQWVVDLDPVATAHRSIRAPGSCVEPRWNGNLLRAERTLREHIIVTDHSLQHCEEEHDPNWRERVDSASDQPRRPLDCGNENHSSRY
jgi:phytoene dehydrogenase-like protein